MTAHATAHRTIPQMRTPPPGASRPLTVTAETTDGIGCLTLSGVADTGSLDLLPSAIDGLFDADVGGILLDGAAVSSWSRRGLQILVLTATRAHGRRIAFAVSGLPPDQLDLLHRQWPGVRSDQFTHPSRHAARAALDDRLGRVPGAS